jgi:hypothetical protein
MKEALITIPLHEYERMKRNINTIDPKFIDGKVMVETSFSVYERGYRFYLPETEANTAIASRIERLQEFKARYLAYMEQPWIIRIFKKPPTP